MTRSVVVAAVAGTALGAMAGFAAGAGPAAFSRTWAWESVKAEPTKVGEVRRFFDMATPTLDRLEVHVTTLRPGEWPHPPHKHPNEELIVVREGTLEAIQEGQTCRLGPGSVILQATNEMHTVRNVGEGPATYHVIQWKSAATPAAQP